MTAAQELSIAHHFAELTDPRIDRSRLHELLDIIAIAICAVVAGAASWDDIEDFGNAKLAWLSTFLDLPNGIPSHDTFRRLFERLDPDEFQRGFLGWIEALHEATERQVVAIDGKALRRSFDRARGKSALHMVHAWATANHLLLGQVAVDEKSNEITAIPGLLEMLSIAGAIVTIDAMGCQKEIARTIRGRKADYVLALKANHEHLFEQVVAFWDGVSPRLMRGPEIGYHREWSEGHGRDEFRRYWATSDLSRLKGREEWEGLRSVVMIEAERFIGDKLSVETRYYLSSLENDAKLLNEAVRSHWAVENSLHWVLDVTFDEDRSRIRKENAPENFGLLRRLALCLLKKESTSRRSIKGKRLQAAWDDGYLQRVLCGNAEN
ncbi:ISAs1 family transposase [Tautonia plasticadhaerens]|uniref:Transposase DDE domain protein n=1 Tax=Tautonia plasticadhaerens TaxID=2527974 RepID=A0A518H4D6_9BACT|nr:ISAs1 family transposase [Tautonia plasticadhaerens]QDV35710.1 Transposase DDE domain protein [Tautonia plasticadhaerens]